MGIGGRSETDRELNVPRPLVAAAPWLAFALVAVSLAATAVLPATACLIVAAGSTMLAALRALLAAHDRLTLRRAADGLLRTGVKVHPQSALLVWRAADLTSDRNREILARSLTRIVQELERPTLMSAIPLNRRALRPHDALVGALAARLAELERPVAARGMVLVEELLTDGFTSPMYIGGGPGDVPAAIERCLDALEGRRAGEEPVVDLAERYRSWMVDRSDQSNRAHSGGSR